LAQSAFEALFMPFATGSEHFLGGIDGFAALGALWGFRWLERHGEFLITWLAASHKQIRKTYIIISKLL